MPFSWMRILIFLTLLGIMFSVKAAPTSGDKWTEDNPCLSNNTRLEVCQRCAKITKSPIVYPMCCKNKEEGFSWCMRYLKYPN